MVDDVKLPSTAEMMEQAGIKVTDGDRLLYGLQDLHQEIKDFNEQLQPKEDIEDALVAARAMPSDAEISKALNRGR